MSPGSYWDRELNPITLDRWVELFKDNDYRFLRETTIQGIGTGLVAANIQTIWVGHDLMVGPEICVFETMVNDNRGRRFQPHRTEQEAIAFHDEEVERQKKREMEAAEQRERN